MNSNPPDAMIATYRLQLSRDFTLYDAAAILPYLKRLGISHVYLSPVNEATEGSNHGYDVSDFSAISAERGGRDGFARLTEGCRELGLKILLDIVPNHMGVAGDNPYWIDVLKHGGNSRYWTVFDFKVARGDKIHLPIMGSPLRENLGPGKLGYEDHEKFGPGVRLGGRYLPLRDESVARIRNEAGNQEIADYIGALSADAQHALLSEQHYCPVFWAESFDTISYRRFFDVNDLAGVRVEDEDIFCLTHDSLFEILGRHPEIAGLRVDHVDGLAHPGNYLRRLAQDVDNVWVEKILTGDEALPASWPVIGTTGYEAIRRTQPLFIQQPDFEKIESYWRENVQPRWKNFAHCVAECKDYVLTHLFASELQRLTRLSADIGIDADRAEKFWRGMTVALPVYRTYFDGSSYPETDRALLDRAYRDFLEGYGGEEEYERLFELLSRPSTDQEKQVVFEWQQLTGPAMAKGLEDTAHYRYAPLAAMNEVGCEPELEPGGIGAYIGWANAVLDSHPFCLLASSTHDTKRSEDTRARLHAMAARPDEWIAFYEKAAALGRGVASERGIPAHVAYFFYQNVAASWPLDNRVDGAYIDRLAAYMAKATSEMKLETGWLEPDQAFVQSLEGFVREILGRKDFIDAVTAYVETVARQGAIRSLAALTLKMLGPGVPDIYQGCEGWNFSLVDPDNRRPVPFEELSKSLEEISSAVPENLIAHWKDGRIKLWLTQALLAVRARHLPANGAYRLEKADIGSGTGLIAYRILPQNGAASLLVLCLLDEDKAGLDKLPGGGYKDVIRRKSWQGDAAFVKEALSGFPVAVLLEER